MLALFRVAPIVPDAGRYIGMLDALTVVGGCGCGCASVDFVPQDTNGSSHIVGDGMGKTSAGGQVGLIVWGTAQAITGLEVYDMGAGQEDLGLPDPASIASWERQTE